jgi:opacity protein-like surface antigen
MFKKGITAFVFIAATSSVYAGGPEVAPPYVGGAYVDVGLSYDNLRNYWRRNTRLSFDSDIVSNLIYRVDSGAQGWDGFLGVGYQYAWNDGWSLGAEVFGDLSSLHGTQLEINPLEDVSSGLTVRNYGNLRVRHTLGVSLLPGYYVARGSLFFVDIGYANSEFEMFNFSAQPSRESNDSGFRLGFGVNTQVGGHFAVKQEYVWETYQALYGDTQVSADSFLYNTNIKSNPTVEKYNLAAVYYFAQQGNAPDLHVAPAHVGGHFYVGVSDARDEAVSQALYRSRANSSESGEMRIYGWNIGLLGGYGFNFSNRWYAGVEIFGDYDDVDASYTVAQVMTAADSFTSRFSKQFDFGAAFMPGYQVSDAALLYARIGYVGSKFEIRTILVGNGGQASGGIGLAPVLAGVPSGSSQTSNFKNDKWLNGLQLGVGVDTMILKNLSLRTEFDVNNFGGFRYTANLPAATSLSDIPAPQASSILTRHKNIVEDQFSLALIWHFLG